jgi:hypothetical protein
MRSRSPVTLASSNALFARGLVFEIVFSWQPVRTVVMTPPKQVVVKPPPQQVFVQPPPQYVENIIEVPVEVQKLVKVEVSRAVYIQKECHLQ